MLLYRAAGESHVAPAELDRRNELLRSGAWQQLLHDASAAARGAGSRGNAQAVQTEAARTRRAEALVHLGELSASSQALVAEPLAAGTQATLEELRDPQRRPPTPYGPIGEDLRHAHPAQPSPISLRALVHCLRGARRGSAARPSGMTNEHLRLLLDEEDDCRLLHGAAELLAQASVPEEALAGIRVGRMVALRKPNGRVRALVVGDVFRRLVGRVLAQHFAPRLQEACLPFQYGLSTRSGT